MKKIIENLFSSDLRKLILELKEIGKSDKPVDIKKSILLNRIFKLSDGQDWSDKYSDVYDTLRREVINRFINETL